MEQLWDIALKAQNTDVSLNAIHYLNNHYINCEWIAELGSSKLPLNILQLMRKVSLRGRTSSSIIA
jgi:hypothetical protein